MKTKSMQNTTATAKNLGVDSQDMPAAKKAYRAPRLEKYGSLRNITLGGSPGVGDSGTSFTEQN